MPNNAAVHVTCHSIHPGDGLEVVWVGTISTDPVEAETTYCIHTYTLTHTQCHTHTHTHTHTCRGMVPWVASPGTAPVGVSCGTGAITATANTQPMQTNDPPPNAITSHMLTVVGMKFLGVAVGYQLGVTWLCV